MQEQRKYVRSSSTALVEMTHPSFGTLSGKARDLSEGGVFVQLGNDVLPPVGTVVQVRIKRYTGTINADPVAMKVMHQQAGGVGLMFL